MAVTIILKVSRSSSEQIIQSQTIDQQRSRKTEQRHAKMLDDAEYRCPDHEATFENEESLLYHLKNHCQDMLKQKNTCTHVQENGKCCRKTFKHTSTLMLHYFKIHDRYACEQCYTTFPTSTELEEHTHAERINVRTSESN